MREICCYLWRTDGDFIDLCRIAENRNGSYRVYGAYGGGEVSLYATITKL